MLSSMLAFDRQAREGRLRIHRRDQAIEAEQVSLGLKETGRKNPIKRAVPS
jgi:hypothetical protein